MISQMLLQGFNNTTIARTLGKHRSSITRELSRGSYLPGITAPYAHNAKRKLEHQAGTRIGNSMLKNSGGSFIKKLKLRWSPRQIATVLKKDFPDQPHMHISHQSIYTYIYLLPKGSLKKELIRYLRQHKKKQTTRKQASTDSRGSIPNMISIEERPAEVADRSVPGHWEGDLIMGKRHASALGSIVERSTRTLILVPLKAKDATSVRKAFARELKSLPRQMRLSLTYDRGKEMAEHELFTSSTKIQVYFCHPQSPWERGTNENTNMLIRQFFPKGTDFTKVTRHEIKHVQKLLNERPREALNWETPKKAFNQLVGSVALKT